MSANSPCEPRRKRITIATDMAIVEAIMIMPMILMNGCPLVKKKTTEPPMPNVGRSCISTLSRCPRGSSGGGCRTISCVGTSDGSTRGGRFTTMWLTVIHSLGRPESPSAAPCQADAGRRVILLTSVGTRGR